MTQSSKTSDKILNMTVCTYNSSKNQLSSVKVIKLWLIVSLVNFDTCFET